ncbi:MAG: PEGA domain-containing protein, partial [bacterium]|nr:PEGA domain-containing protein [bacterium]
MAAERLLAARGGIIVRAEPADAEVTVGALEHGSAPLTLKEVRLGKYPVKARLPGYDDWSGEVEVKENEFAEVYAHLVRSTGKLQIATGAAGVNVDITPEDKDGAAQRIRPPQTLTLPTGRYALVFKRAGWSDRTRKISVARGGAETVEESYADANRPANWLFHASTSELTAAAETGWLEAQIRTGDHHYFGLSGKVNYPEALKWYQRAAAAGSASAPGRLALLAAKSGIGVKASGDPVRWLMEGVRAGDPVAVLDWHQRLSLGWAGEPIPEPKVEAAVRAMTQAAEQGDGVAMQVLAVHYFGGRTGLNPAEGLKWIRAAVEAGNKSALRTLAYAYSEGRGVSKDEAAAFGWLQKGTEAGDAGAMRSLGQAYANGKGVPKDEAAALKWEHEAADLGNSDALVSLGFFYANGLGVTKDDAAAIAWWRKAADMGNPSAIYNLGWAYRNGRGVTSDDAAALEWYRRAANMGNAAALSSIGVAYSNGKGVAQSDIEAVTWWRKAAEADNTTGIHNLGWAYANGRGV